MFPVILSQTTMENRGLALGDTMYIHHFDRDTTVWDYPAKIIGVHNGEIRRDGLEDAAILPVSVLEVIHGIGTRYITARFEINPGKNRELEVVQEEWEDIARIRNVGDAVLDFVWHDAELRQVVEQTERNLSLLLILYPIAVTASLLIGFGLGLLLMLPNAKNAAIMRVLGAKIGKTRRILGTGQLLCCVLGLFLGLTIQYLAGWNQAGQLTLLIQAGLYFAVMLIGSGIGMMVITKHTPIELLQVKE